MLFQQRDIVLIHFPFTDLTQTKLRPALIISSNKIGISDFVCIQITSKVSRDSTYLHLEDKMLEGKLALASGLRLHKIFCLNNKLIIHKIAAITPEAFQSVIQALNQKVFNLI
ncbi:MAG: type II toxin-antitoxin system PemK/MazF family toxin [Cyclobacteriaceae bacterium]|nr:type II toxin-antitoxin system PemK/MazF family toxin [Cytophagales bacterium]MBX2899269.1 type II toxin-antitoxin system PemK/MazF family toxin [Cyclobacteriaceae bacterium]